jgi:predicted lactoylglutathione lyase
MVDTPEEVDQLTDQMRNAGARVTKEPVDAEFFNGRSAYLCDPESNYFEITWAEPDNPIASRRHQILTAMVGDQPIPVAIED